MAARLLELALNSDPAVVVSIGCGIIGLIWGASADYAKGTRYSGMERWIGMFIGLFVGYALTLGFIALNFLFPLPA